MRGAICLAAIAVSISAANAQAIKAEPEQEKFTATQLAEISYPDTEFSETEADAKVYDKYFYFHRDDTGFDQAFADINECDSLARGAGYYRTSVSYYSPQLGIAGSAIGGMVGSLVADAIFGSAERRRVRRVNLRSCMGFKGYNRYGLEKERWQKFHFEEGFGEANENKRREYFLVQAKVASGPKPSGEVLVK